MAPVKADAALTNLRFFLDSILRLTVFGKLLVGKIFYLNVQ